MAADDVTDPIIGFEAADEALSKRMAEDGGDLSAEVAVWLRELHRCSGAASREPTRREQIASLTFDELLADRFLLDRMTRAVSLARDLDYMEALEELRSWSPGGTSTVAAVFDIAPISLDDVCSDVVKMEAAEIVPEAEELLDSSDPERRVSIEATDEIGRIILADGVDRAFLLTDTYTIERAWLKARDLDERGVYRSENLGDGLTGRERFEQHYREHIEDGADLVASLEAEDRLRRGPGPGGAGPSTLRRETHERAERAERRKLEAQRDEADAKLRGT